MIIKGLLDEDFVQYKKPSMTIMFPRCSFKCEKECGERVCQNSTLAMSKDLIISLQNIKERYITNNITSSIVCAGLEPFDTWNDLYSFITYIRKYTDDDIVIYTGYNKNEIENKVLNLSKYKNIIIKFGRYIPNQNKHYDEILGVYLASDNQHAEKIKMEN